MTNRCEGRVNLAGLNFARDRQCNFTASEQVDGKWYCKTHDPSRIAKKVAKRAELSAVKWKARSRSWALEGAAPALLEACECLLSNPRATAILERYDPGTLEKIKNAVECAKAKD
jgi:hypothetical protein